MAGQPNGRDDSETGDHSLRRTQIAIRERPASELGAFGSDSWLAKHSLGDDITVPQNIENHLKRHHRYHADPRAPRPQGCRRRHRRQLEAAADRTLELSRMKYVSIDDGGLSAQAYLAVVPELADELPPGARAFATDPAHYNFYSRHCVEDLTLGPITHEIGFEAVDVQIVLASSGLRHDEWG